MSRWLLIQQEINHLGIMKNLVNAGDYDSDGKSELIFSYSGYNRDGYIIVYGEDYLKHTDFIWNYH
jgi:hypothetical protein